MNPTTKADKEKPDILILLVDQFNPYCMGCAGDPVVRTPNLDALAAEGSGKRGGQ